MPACYECGTQFSGADHTNKDCKPICPPCADESASRQRKATWTRSTCPNCGSRECRQMNRSAYEVKVKDKTNIVLGEFTTLRASRYLHRRCVRCESEVSITFDSSHVERCGNCGGPWPKTDNYYPQGGATFNKEESD